MILEHKSICVFCASSSKIEAHYFDAAKQLAEVCIENQIHVLYGGGNSGLMGALADGILHGNGKITGIIPSFMKDMHWFHEDVAEMIVVNDMRERKKRMIENVDAVTALPGGVGTLEELLEVITLKQLGRFVKPIIIVNTDGFYDPLLAFFEQMIGMHFMRDTHRDIWSVIDHPASLLEAIGNSTGWDESAIQKASL
jgi:uncharacterized protein (TIGR00730 family)